VVGIRGPLHQRHNCRSCRFLGTHGRIDVYECGTSLDLRHFVVRSDNTEEIGHAVLDLECGNLIINPPDGSDPADVALAVVKIMEMEAVH
jgi:hypothetical protein